MPSILLNLDEETYRKLKILKALFMCDHWTDFVRTLTRVISPEFYLNILFASMKLYFELEKIDEKELLEILRDPERKREFIDRILRFVLSVKDSEIAEVLKREASRLLLLNPLLRDLHMRLVML